MKYFNTLPKVVKTENTGVQTFYTNIMSRVHLLSDKLSNPLLFYTYDIQEGDTPEIIAEKYYGDPYRYWIVLLSNNIMDPQWEWPLLNNAFSQYISEKYTDFNPYTTVHHYEKVITQYDSGTQTTTKNIVTIDEEQYNLLNNTTTSYSFPSGTCTVSITKNATTYFEYEMELNESKRNIRLLKKEYAAQIEGELIKLMK